MIKKSNLKYILDPNSFINDKRENKLNIILENFNYKEICIDNLSIYLMESLGYNSSMKNFIHIISDKINEYISAKKGYSQISFDLIIKQLGITNVLINFNNFGNTSIIKKLDLLIIDYSYNMVNIPDPINIIRTKIDHELHHVFINEMGNKTKKDYFIVNNIINKYSDRTRAFLMLYYLSFKDEVSCNIQMFFREIGNANIKTKLQFVPFLENNELYKISKKMIDVDVLNYWQLISDEGNAGNLINDFKIQDLEIFLDQVSKQIKKAGNEYRRKLSRVFI